MFRIESYAKQQVCIDDLSEKRASAQIRIEQRSDFRWRRAKAWKRCQAWFWIDCNQSLQPNRSQMKCDVWKPCSDQRWQDELRFSIWRFFEQSSLVNIHLQCYWPAIHNSISKIFPKFEVISFHFFKVDELLDKHWAKIFQLQSMSNAIRCINQRFAFKNSRISCLALIFKLKNTSTTVLYAKKISCRWRNMTINIPFVSSTLYEPMAWWLRLVAESQATWARILMIAEILSRA